MSEFEATQPVEAVDESVSGIHIPGDTEAAHVPRTQQPADEAVLASKTPRTLRPVSHYVQQMLEAMKADGLEVEQGTDGTKIKRLRNGAYRLTLAATVRQPELAL